MDDLVKRLRDKYCCDGINICNCDESADRIELLIEEREQFKAAFQIADQMWSKISARCDQLEAALRQICDGQRDADKSYAELFAEVCWEARAALGEKKDD